nr:phage tail protein [uncultured Duganella sp.]
MSGRRHRSYRFSTPAQWSACLFDRVDREVFDAGGAIQPIAPYGQDARLYPSQGAWAPAATRAGEVLWHDAAGCLYRLPSCGHEAEQAPDIDPAPAAIARAARLVASAHGLWVIGPSGRLLERYDEATLSRLEVVDLAGARIVDIASGGRGQLYALVERADAVAALRLDCAGHVVETLVFEGITRPVALVFLRRAQRFVVMAEGARPRLYWFAAEAGAAVRSIDIGALHPCFGATALGGDGRNRVMLAGNNALDLGRAPFVFIFDGDGEPLGEIALDPRDAPATGVAGTRGALFVTGARGLLRYGAARVVPDATAEVRCSLVTPLLYAPEQSGTSQRRWLRIEASATLPDGASLDICYASTADPALHRRLTAMAGDDTMPAGLRARALLREPGIWSAPVTFQGGRPAPGETEAPLSAPLYDAQAPYVWVSVTLTATAGGALPALDELAVLYGGPSLMDHLPAIYRRAEAQPGSFLRSLVGVLESTTQGLDARIAALAGHVHPATATGPWLDFVAGWLGLPWDDALDEQQKRRLLASAAELARGRGTRAGLEALLACLIPGTPPRFRVVDATADVGFAIVGGAGCPGSALPALLGGRAPGSAELDFSTVLGHMRLRCEGQSEDGVRTLAGRVRVDVAATGEERRAWEPWLATLIGAMIPLTARLRLRWVGTRAPPSGRLDGTLVLEAPPTPHLGGDAVLGVARLPERGSRITGAGADIGTRLQ